MRCAASSRSSNLSQGRVSHPRSLRPSAPLSAMPTFILPDGGRKIAGSSRRAAAASTCAAIARSCRSTRASSASVPVDVVLADIAQQVASRRGACFLRRPGFFQWPDPCAEGRDGACTREFPQLTFDATIKIQHLIDHAALLADADAVRLSVHHLGGRVGRRPDPGIPRQEPYARRFRARFVALPGKPVLRLRLRSCRSRRGRRSMATSTCCASSCACIWSRPCRRCSFASACLCRRDRICSSLPAFRDVIEAFDAKLLGYPWRHADPRVDALQQEVQACRQRE